MTHPNDTVDLINLSDGHNGVRVHVLGRRDSGNLPLHDLLDAELIVESSFISGRIRICFYPPDLEKWALALDSLGTGRSIEWLDTGNGPTVRIEFPDGDTDSPTVLVEDGSSSGTTAAVPVALDSGWVQEQHEHLRKVLDTWPSEVLATSPGAYEWRK